MADVAGLVRDLEDEQVALQDLLEGASEEQWLAPTPAEGWDVRDSVSHLADTDEMAVDTVLGGPRAINAQAERYGSPDELTLAGCLRGREMDGPGVLEWWRVASAREREVFAATDPASRVEWGIGMQLPTLVTARIMETWAHGLDIRNGIGAPPRDTDVNLSHVAWIGVRALPYAFQFAGVSPPGGELRVELTLPSGSTFSTGPGAAGNVIRGTAAEFCRVFVQRLDRSEAASLTAEGDLADAALDVARAYL